MLSPTRLSSAHSKGFAKGKEIVKATIDRYSYRELEQKVLENEEEKSFSEMPLGVPNLCVGQFLYRLEFLARSIDYEPDSLLLVEYSKGVLEGIDYGLRCIDSKYYE